MHSGKLAPFAAAFVAGILSFGSINPAQGSVSISSVSISDRKVLFTDEAFDVVAGLAYEDGNNATEASWEFYIDDKLESTGTVSLDCNPSEFSVGTFTVQDKGSHNFDVKLVDPAGSEGGSTSMIAIAPAVSIVPLIILIFVAMITRTVEVSLFFGVFLGACIITGTIADGFKTTLDTYLINSVADEGHAYVVLFTFFLSGLVGMIQKSGGMLGLTDFLIEHAKTARVTQVLAFFGGLLLFFDDYANCLILGVSVRPSFDRFSISREKLAFIVDATAANVASIVPVSSWVGFEVGLIDTEIQKIIENNGGEVPEGFESSAFAVFMQSIAYRFYPWFMLFLVLFLAIFQRDFGSMLVAERKTMVYQRTDGGDAATVSKKLKDPKSEPKEDTPRRLYNMLVPIILLVILIFYILYQSGVPGSAEDASFIEVIENSDSYVALLYGSMGAALCTLIFYWIQFKKNGQIVCALPRPFACFGIGESYEDSKGSPETVTPLMTPGESVHAFLVTLNRVFPAIVVLVLAWAAGAVMVDVGADRYIGAAIKDSIDPRILSTLTFILAMLIALATGSSWSTMSLVFPLVLVPTWEATEDMNIFLGVVASVLSGAVAGDMLSFISDTSILSALSTECNLLRHVVTQAPYGAYVILVSILLGTIPTGYGGYSAGVGVFIGIVFMLITVFVIGVPVLAQSGRFDIFTELYILISKDKSLNRLREDTKLAASGNQPMLEEEGATDPETARVDAHGDDNQNGHNDEDDGSSPSSPSMEKQSVEKPEISQDNGSSRVTTV